MIVRGNGETIGCHFQRGGGAAAMALVLLLLIPTMGSTGSSEDLTRPTLQRTAQFIQDVCPIHSGAIVVQPEQGRIGHAGFFSQAINRPALLLKKVSELADDHADNLPNPADLCQLNHICEPYFTYYGYRSRVAPCLSGHRAPSAQWKTTAIGLRTSISRTFHGLLSVAAGGRT
jgi:hypothetical protein